MPVYCNCTTNTIDFERYIYGIYEILWWSIQSFHKLYSPLGKKSMHILAFCSVHFDKNIQHLSSNCTCPCMQSMWQWDKRRNKNWDSIVPKCVASKYVTHLLLILKDTNKCICLPFLIFSHLYLVLRWICQFACIWIDQFCLIFAASTPLTDNRRQCDQNRVVDAPSHSHGGGRHAHKAHAVL